MLVFKVLLFRSSCSEVSDGTSQEVEVFGPGPVSSPSSAGSGGALQAGDGIYGLGRGDCLYQCRLLRVPNSGQAGRSDSA